MQLCLEIKSFARKENWNNRGVCDQEELGKHISIPIWFLPLQFLSLFYLLFYSFRFVYLSDLQVFWVNKGVARFRILMKHVSFPLKTKAINFFSSFSLSLLECPAFMFLNEHSRLYNWYKIFMLWFFYLLNLN